MQFWLFQSQRGLNSGPLSFVTPSMRQVAIEIQKTNELAICMSFLDVQVQFTLVVRK